MIKRLLLRRAAAAFMLVAPAACAAAPEPAPPAGAEAVEAAPASEAAPAFSDIEGSWRIVSVDGAAPRGTREDSGGERTPRIAFGPSSYGGTSGCNFFGGLGLFEAGRYYAAPAMQTLIGCGDLTAQEDAITGAFRGAPQLSLDEAGRLLIAGASHRMLLERGGAPAAPAAEEEYRPAVLAGTSWTLGTLDDMPLRAPGREGGGALRFEADRWSAQAACATLSGTWRQERDRIVLTGPSATTEQLCPEPAAAMDARLGALMAANPRFVTGPNGELLIAGGGHMAVGERRLEAMTDQSALLAGRWRVEAIDGRAPAAGTQPALLFRGAGYRGHTGCNSIQGLFLAHRGRLLTHPGPQTEQGCGPLTAQEARITGLLAASPRIAAAGEGRLALVDRDGMIRLRRQGPAAAAEDVPRALPTPSTLGAALLAFDGEALRMRVEEPESRLRLAARRWDMRVRCIEMGGVMRREGAVLRFFTDPPPSDTPQCPEAQGALGDRLMRLMNGEARALVGVNGELLIAGDEHWLTGQIERPSRPR
ncbi:MAG TPA: META domain-containing protein [Allosphingosinicella sp.]|nr:META domain-containing protein [Allosphingosinicella sp.]